MTGQLTIREQNYPTASGETPLSYGIFLETDEVVEGLAHWQDCQGVFVAYSWSHEGALIAIAEIERVGNVN